MTDGLPIALPAGIPLSLDYAAPAPANRPPPPLDYSSLWAGRLPYTPVWRVVLEHVLTLSLSSVFRFSALHGRLPRTRPDDPCAAKALVLLFVPIVNFYWLFFTWLRLCDRLAEQRRLQGLPPSDTKTLCLVACVLMFVPYVNLLSIFLLQPALFACLQAEVNELHHMGFASPSAEVPVAKAVPVFDFAFPE
jgi:hypothetical protein